MRNFAFICSLYFGLLHCGARTNSEPFTSATPDGGLADAVVPTTDAGTDCPSLAAQTAYLDSLHSQIKQEPLGADKSSCSLKGYWNSAPLTSSSGIPTAEWYFDGKGHFIVGAKGLKVCEPSSSTAIGTYTVTQDRLNIYISQNMSCESPTWDYANGNWMTHYAVQFENDCKSFYAEVRTPATDNCTGGRKFMSGGGAFTKKN